MPNCPARVGSGEHGHDGGDPPIRPACPHARGCRPRDREPGLDGGSDQASVLNSDRIVAERGLVGEGDRLFAGVGNDELFEAAR
jgi:hypothetical protein